MIESIREFIRHFFLCEECSKHFLSMTTNAANEIHSYKENVLYLWRGNQYEISHFNYSKSSQYLGHNKVNKRLRVDELTNDPSWPKVPFPTKEQCNSCVRQVDENYDAVEYDENETYNYLKNYYNLKNVSSKKNTATNLRYNHLLSLFLFPLMFFVTF